MELALEEHYYNSALPEHHRIHIAHCYEVARSSARYFPSKKLKAQIKAPPVKDKVGEVARRSFSETECEFNDWKARFPTLHHALAVAETLSHNLIMQERAERLQKEISS